LSVHRLPALRLSLGVQVPPVLERSHVERLLALAFQIPSNSNLQMCMKNPTELVALDAPLNAMFGQMAHGTAGGLKKMGEMYLIVQLYTRLQFVNLSVATIANIKDLGRRIDCLGDFGDGLGHTPYISGSMSPNDRLRGALNLARGVIMRQSSMKQWTCPVEVMLHWYPTIFHSLLLGWRCRLQQRASAPITPVLWDGVFGKVQRLARGGGGVD